MAFHSRCRWYFGCSITGNVNTVSSAATAVANLCLDSGGWRALCQRPSSWRCLTNETQTMKQHSPKYHFIGWTASWHCVFPAVFPPVVHPEIRLVAAVVQCCCSSQELLDRKGLDPDFNLFTIPGFCCASSSPSQW